MIDSLCEFLGITSGVSGDVQFAVSAGLVFLLFCVFLVGLGSVFGRWFR